MAFLFQEGNGILLHLRKGKSVAAPVYLGFTVLWFAVSFREREQQDHPWLRHAGGWPAKGVSSGAIVFLREFSKT